VAKQSRRSRRPGYRIHREDPSLLAGILQALVPPWARIRRIFPRQRLGTPVRLTP
jgi:hypothetical protein